ncbi:outer membrane protein [Herbaspirillum seropedicae]|uniref:outer membrane protein n=1 Tax=Herbaspirillum seropedicae TaxID=964 RepID=UPI003FCD48A2
MQQIIKGALALTLGVSALAAAPAMAQQAGAFTGLKLGGNLAWRHTKVELQGFLNQSVTDNDTVLQLDLAYGFALAPAWTLDLGLTYDLSKTDAGTLQYADGNRTGRLQIKTKNHYSVYLAPGYVLHKDWQVYGKLAYHHLEGEYNDSLSPSGTTKHGGFGYGVGVNYAFSRNVLLGVEVQQVRYSREMGFGSSGKPQTTDLSFRAAYRF